MRIIKRMNAYAQERSALQKSEEGCVPCAADAPAPTGPNGVTERSCRKHVSRTEDADRGQACRGLHVGVGRSARGCVSKQPGTRNNASRLQPVRAQRLS